MPGVIFLLFVAIATEVVATSLLPQTDGFRRPGWTVVVVAGYAVSIWMLSVVVRNLPISTAYAIWSGLGTAAVALVGIFVLGERVTLASAVGLAMIVIGVVVVHSSGAH